MTQDILCKNDAYWPSWFSPNFLTSFEQWLTTTEYFLPWYFLSSVWHCDHFPFLEEVVFSLALKYTCVPTYMYTCVLGLVPIFLLLWMYCEWRQECNAMVDWSLHGPTGPHSLGPHTMGDVKHLLVRHVEKTLYRKLQTRWENNTNNNNNSHPTTSPVS